MSKRKPKDRPAAFPNSFFVDRSKTPLPRERCDDMPFVLCPGGRPICPWPKGPLHFLDEARLLAVLARVDGLEPAGPVWVWPDPHRPPVPVQAEDPRSWVVRWQEGRSKRRPIKVIISL